MKNKFVHNNFGYTLLEGLISLVVLSIVIFSLLNFLNVMKTNVDTNYNFKETALFISQIQEDFLEAKEVKIKNPEELNMLNYLDEEIEYKYEGNRLIRQKENKGYEIMLNDVSEGSFYINQGLVYTKVKFVKGNKQYDWVLNHA